MSLIDRARRSLCSVDGEATGFAFVVVGMRCLPRPAMVDGDATGASFVGVSMDGRATRAPRTSLWGGRGHRRRPPWEGEMR